MNLKKEGFTIIPDNDVQYFTLLEGVINSVDSYSIGIVIKTPTNYLFRISLSSPEYVNTIISSINDLHNFLKIRLNYSKSAKKNGTISFSIPIFAEEKVKL